MRNKSKIATLFWLILFIFLLSFYFNINAQESLTGSSSSSSSSSASSSNSLSLERHFHQIYLGMKADEFENVIKQNNIIVEGELEVYMKQPDKSVIAILYPPFFRKILCYFFEDELKMMIFFVNPVYISLYDEYLRLYKKYGQPEVNQQQFIWEDEKTLLILERDPFIIKMIDKTLLQNVEEKEQELNQLLEQSIDDALDTL
ncbi:MAG: hypothetical protein KBG82_00665 [Spirochaetes bacterium]|nr:hypothetical protein [Spirochaetota bacterium]NLJ05270.1 hypothetical protein [Exilispira sp.]MBP8990472.1 hypothetical protein [Spirochaetota bacterium]HNV44024.1 hypothetical protein [Exilispira sp.]HOV45534.1 hypothetical protein [Exilispira sp.]